MEYNEFKEQLIAKVSESFKDKPYTVNIDENYTNSRGTMEALCVRFDEHIGVNYSLSAIYRHMEHYHLSVEEVISHIEADYAEHISTLSDIATKNMFTKDFILENVHLMALNLERSGEYLIGKVFRKVEDLAAVCVVPVAGGIVTITDNILKSVGLDALEVLEQADINMKSVKYNTININKVLRELTDGEMVVPAPSFEDLEMLPVTSNFGAGIMFSPDILKSLADKYNVDSFRVLPSSKHEIIITSADDINLLQTMVKEVNESEVSPEDYLSDNVYEFDAKTCELHIAITKELENDNIIEEPDI